MQEKIKKGWITCMFYNNDRSGLYVNILNSDSKIGFFSMKYSEVEVLNFCEAGYVAFCEMVDIHEKRKHVEMLLK